MAVHYRPVLPARRGELDALADVARPTWDRMTPLLELVPDRRRPAPQRCRLLRDRLRDSWQEGMRLAVGVGTADPAGGVLVGLWRDVRDVLAEVTPTVGLGDRRALAELRTAGALGRGVVLRLRPAELGLAPGALDAAVAALLGPAGLDRADVDLVADLGPAPVDTADLPGAVGSALSDRTWRSRTLVCGPSPPRPGAPGAVPRRDVRTWREVGAALGPAGRDLDFGDHAVARPAPRVRPRPAPRPAAPDRWPVAPGRPGPRSRLGCAAPAAGRELDTARHLEFVARVIQAEDRPPG